VHPKNANPARKTQRPKSHCERDAAVPLSSF
jgi:hypothetical protein